LTMVIWASLSSMGDLACGADAAWRVAVRPQGDVEAWV